MPKLAAADFARLLNSVNILHSAIDASTLAERSLSSVVSLIPNEMTAFDGFNQETGYQHSYWYSPPGTVSESQIQVLAQTIHEHPYYLEGIATKGEKNFRVSDYIPLAKFHQLAVYNEFYKDFGGDTQISCIFDLSPDSVVTCSLMRPKTDFSDREFALLQHLTPHLAAAFRNARTFEGLERERSFLSELSGKGLIVLDAASKIGFISERAVRLLEAYFPGFQQERLPGQLERFVREHSAKLDAAEYFRPPDAYAVENERGKLRIEMIFDGTAGEVRLVLDETKKLTTRDISVLGLTDRETEIMYWLCHGKSNFDIGRLCGISVRTVQKHVENIFVKMGVETRSAAIATAYQQIR